MEQVLIITGTPSKTSRLNGVMNYVVEQLKNNGIRVSQIDVCDLPADELLHTKFDSPAIREAKKLVENADGIIIATPVYKASYSGILKAFLDLIPEKGLENKLILPVAMGGTVAHLLMLEYAVKPVLSVLGANHIEAGVFIQDRQVKWNDDRKVDIEEESASRLKASIINFISKSTTVNV